MATLTSEGARSYAEEYWREVLLNSTPDMMVEWNLGTTQESCQTCASLASLGPLSVTEFVERDIYPQSQDLACGGFNCRCFLTLTDAPMTATGVDALLSDLTTFGTIGDAGLSSLYEDFVNRSATASADWSGLTPLSSGKSWFDAPASGAGSFQGLRYGDTSTAGGFERRATPPNYADASVNAGMNDRISFEVAASSRGSFQGARYGSSETMQTVGERQWLQRPTPDPSTFDAPASSAGSFAGERFGD